MKLNTDILSAVFEASRQGVGVLNAVPSENNDVQDFRWVLANDAMFGILGHDLLGKLLSEVLPAFSVTDNIKHIQSNARFISDVQAIVNGRRHWLTISASKIDESLVLTMEDITSKKESEEELETKSRLLEKVLQVPNVGVTVFKSIRNNNNEIVDFEYQFVGNKKYKAMASADVTGKKLFDLLPSAKMHLNNYRAVVESGVVHTYEAPFRDNGRERWFLNTNVKFGDGFINVWEDISERKRIEETLAEERTRINLAESLGHVGSFEWNTVTNKMHWSDELYRIHGLQPQSEEITLDRLLRLVHPDDVGLVKQKLKRGLKHEGIIKFTHRLLLPDGTLRHITRTIESFADERGNIIRINGNVQDITEIKDNEKKLQEVNRQLVHKIYEVEQREAHLENFERIVNSSHDAIISVDLEGKVIQWSNAAEQFYGYSANEMIGQSLLVIVPDGYQSEFLTLVNRVQQGESFVDIETVRINRRKQRMDVVLNLFPLKDEKGSVIGSCGVTKDITERRKAEKDLVASKERFEAAINLSPNVLSIVSSIRNESNEINDFCFDWVSTSGMALAGKDVTGFKLSEAFPYIRAIGVFSAFVNTVETGAPTDMENYYSTEDFSAWLKWKAVKLEDGLFVSIEDIGERKKNEEELKKNKDLLQSVFDAVQSSVTVYRTLYNFEKKAEDFEILMFNDFAFRTSFTTPAIIGKRLSEVFPSTKHNGILQKFLDVADNGTPIKFEQLYQGDRMSNWLYFNVSRLGNLLIVITEDTTNRRKAEDENYKHLQILQQTEEVAGIGTWEYVLERDEFNCSEGIYRLFELPTGVRMSPETYIQSAIDDDKDVAERIVTYIKNDPQNFEEIIRIKSDPIKILKVKGKPLREGSISRMIGVALDITAIVQSEKALKDQAHFINQIAITIPDIISVTELETRKIEYVNIAALDTSMFGYEVLDMSQEELLALIHPDDMEPLHNYFKNFYALSDQDSITLEFRAKNKFNDWSWFKARGKVFKRNDFGRATHGVNIVQNITEQKNADRALRENRELLQSVFSSTTNTIAVLKPVYKEQSSVQDFEIVFANKDSLPYHEGTNPVGVRVGEFYASESGAEASERLIQKLKTVLETGESTEYDQVISHESKHWLHTVAVKLENEIVVTQQDITESVESRMNLEQLNESLKQKNLELKSRNQELANFAFIASHDLREPLRKILVFSNYLLEKEEANISQQGRDYCLKIIRAINRMNALIDDILEYSRASSSPLTQHVIVDLNDVLKNVLLDISELIAENKAIIEYDSLPSIKGNPLQLSQLFQNLITNGIKFKRQNVTPHITVISDFVKGRDIDSPLANPNVRYVTLEVADNGIGFESKFTDKIFQMFQRLHDRSEFPGTGMGLAICKRVVENHKGFIMAMGKPGEGAVFKCYFPIR